MFGRTCVCAGLLSLITATASLAHAQAEELPLIPTPPPAAADPGPVAETPARDRTHGLVLVPCLGMNVPMGKLADRFTQGFHLGVVGGWHLLPRVSLNGGLALDLMNDNDSTIFEPHEFFVDATLTPLVHFQSGAMFIGPQIGWFANRRSRTATSGNLAPVPDNHSGQGLVAGITAGAFAPVSKFALGLVAGASYRRFVASECEGIGCSDKLDSLAKLDVSLAALY